MKKIAVLYILLTLILTSCYAPSTSGVLQSKNSSSYNDISSYVSSKSETPKPEHLPAYNDIPYYGPHSYNEDNIDALFNIKIPPNLKVLDSDKHPQSTWEDEGNGNPVVIEKPYFDGIRYHSDGKFYVCIVMGYDPKYKSDCGHWHSSSAQIRKWHRVDLENGNVAENPVDFVPLDSSYDNFGTSGFFNFLTAGGGDIGNYNGYHTNGNELYCYDKLLFADDLKYELSSVVTYNDQYILYVASTSDPGGKVTSQVYRVLDIKQKKVIYTYIWDKDSQKRLNPLFLYGDKLYCRSSFYSPYWLVIIDVKTGKKTECDKLPPEMDTLFINGNYVAFETSCDRGSDGELCFMDLKKGNEINKINVSKVNGKLFGRYTIGNILNDDLFFTANYKTAKETNDYTIFYQYNMKSKKLTEIMRKDYVSLKYTGYLFIGYAKDSLICGKIGR